MKKTLAVILSLCMLLTSAVTTFAVESAPDLAYTVNEDGTTATVTGYLNPVTTEHTLTIPKTVAIEGSSYTVTAIAKDAFKSALCTAVTIPDSVKSIGESAFNSCAKLVSVNISTDSGNISDCLLPPALETIGKSAFKACKLLETALVIPSTLGTVSYGAFYECVKIPSLTISEGVSKIEGEVFYRLGDTSKSITTITMPSTLTDYNLSAINGNYTTKLIFNTNPGSTVTFSGSSTKRGVNLWDGTTGGCLGGSNAKNGYAHFYSESIALLKDLQKALESSFNTSYSDLYLNTNFIYGNGKNDGTDVISVDGYKYNNMALVYGEELGYDFSATLIAKVDEATEAYSYSCAEPITYNQGETDYKFVVNAIGPAVFAGTSSAENAYLTSFTASDELKSVGDQAFQYCTALTECDLGDGVLTVGYRAFHESGVTEISLPSVTTIGEKAFETTKYLSTVHFGNEITTIPGDAFKNSYISYLIIPSNVTKITSNIPSNGGYVRKLRYIIFEGDTLPENWKPIANSLGGQICEASYVYVKQAALDAYNATADAEDKLSDGDVIVEGKENEYKTDNNVYLKVLTDKPIIDYLSSGTNYNKAFVYNPSSSELNGTYIMADYGSDNAKLNSAFAVNVTVPAGGVYFEDTNVKIAADRKTNVKVYLWADMMPLTMPISRKPW